MHNNRPKIMSKHQILTIPDPKLRRVTELVHEITPELQDLIDEMFQVMYDADGVGLASTQIGLPMRLAVIDVSRSRNEPMVIINPEIIESRDPVSMQEGCLSVPGHVDRLVRPNWVRVRTLNRDGVVNEFEASDLLAECLQHEIDHLHGKLYIDYLPKLKQNLILKKVQRYVKKQQRR